MGLTEIGVYLKLDKEQPPNQAFKTGKFNPNNFEVPDERLYPVAVFYGITLSQDENQVNMVEGCKEICVHRYYHYVDHTNEEMSFIIVEGLTESLESRLSRLQGRSRVSFFKVAATEVHMVMVLLCTYLQYAATHQVCHGNLLNSIYFTLKGRAVLLPSSDMAYSVEKFNGDVEDVLRFIKIAGSGNFSLSNLDKQSVELNEEEDVPACYRSFFEYLQSAKFRKFSDHIGAAFSPIFLWSSDCQMKLFRHCARLYKDSEVKKDVEALFRELKFDWKEALFKLGPDHALNTLYQRMKYSWQRYGGTGRDASTRNSSILQIVNKLLDYYEAELRASGESLSKLGERFDLLNESLNLGWYVFLVNLELARAGRISLENLEMNSSLYAKQGL